MELFLAVSYSKPGTLLYFFQKIIPSFPCFSCNKQRTRLLWSLLVLGTKDHQICVQLLLLIFDFDNTAHSQLSQCRGSDSAASLNVISNTESTNFSWIVSSCRLTCVKIIDQKTYNMQLPVVTTRII